MKLARITLFLMAATLALAGCKTTTTADRRIVIDEGLRDRVAVVNVNSTTVGDDLLKVQVELLNKTKSLQRFVYNFQWFDSHGFVINNTRVLTPDQVDGGQSTFISAVAPAPATTDYRLRIMSSQSSLPDDEN